MTIVQPRSPATSASCARARVPRRAAVRDEQRRRRAAAAAAAAAAVPGGRERAAGGAVVPFAVVQGVQGLVEGGQGPHDELPHVVPVGDEGAVGGERHGLDRVLVLELVDDLVRADAPQGQRAFADDVLAPAPVRDEPDVLGREGHAVDRLPAVVLVRDHRRPALEARRRRRRRPARACRAAPQEQPTERRPPPPAAARTPAAAAADRGRFDAAAFGAEAADLGRAGRRRRGCGASPLRLLVAAVAAFGRQLSRQARDLRFVARRHFCLFDEELYEVDSSLVRPLARQARHVNTSLVLFFGRGFTTTVASVTTTPETVRSGEGASLPRRV